MSVILGETERTMGDQVVWEVLPQLSMQVWG